MVEKESPMLVLMGKQSIDGDNNQTGCGDGEPLREQTCILSTRGRTRTACLGTLFACSGLHCFRSVVLLSAHVSWAITPHHNAPGPRADDAGPVPRPYPGSCSPGCSAGRRPRSRPSSRRATTSRPSAVDAPGEPSVLSRAIADSQCVTARVCMVFIFFCGHCRVCSGIVSE